MAQTTFNNPILKGWLTVYIIINVICIIYLWSNFLTVGLQTPNLSLETSLCTVTCITNIVGIVYLSRNLRFGIYILFLVPIIVLAVQSFLIGNVSIPIYIYILLSVFTAMLLCLKSNNKIIWAQMNDGIDIKHFKHIYQLSIFFIVVVVGWGIYNYSTFKDSSNEDLYDEELLSAMTQEEVLRELDKKTITLGKISKIEKVVKEFSPECEARIMALRHILAGHIVPNIHDIDAFKMAYFLRKDAMSKEQQEILDWFFRQHNDVMEVWKTSDGCSDLASFQKYIKDIIKNRKITEF